MRRYLRVAATFLALLSLATWVAFGANRGWTKTTHTRLERDPVTDIEYPVVEKNFSPGIELLGLGLFSSASLAGISFAFKPKPKH